MEKEQLEALLYRPDHIRTFSGLYLNVVDPKPEQIHIQDIAHALSRAPRFGGHLEHFYSVAHHSINAAHIVSPEYKLEALLHDATEAYLGDLPSPIKNHCHNYKILERNLYKVIARKYGIPIETSSAVKMADRKLLEFEFEHYHLKTEAPVHGQNITVKEEFLKLFYTWTKDRN